MEDELQDEGFGEEKVESAPSKKKGGKNPIVLIGGVVVLAVVAYFIVTGLVKPWLFPEQAEGEEAAQAKVEEVQLDVFEPGFVHVIEDVTVNVRDRNRTRYLSINVALEFEKSGPPDKFDLKLPHITDMIRRIFAKLPFEKAALDVTYEDTIKMDIMAEVNTVLAEKEKVRRISFEKKVAQ